MGSYSPMSANPGRILNGLYESLPANQWVREALHNSMDAGATKVDFGLYDMFGVKKRYILDDGVGMVSKSADAYIDADQADYKGMVELMDLGSSENEDDHFGVGAKVSMLNWNAFGMLYLSKKQVDHGVVMSACWLGIRDGQPVFLDMPSEDGIDPNPVLFVWDDDGVWYDEVALSWLTEELGGTTPWDLLEDRRSGTVVMLLGEKPEDGTDDGNPRYASIENKYRSIMRYLNERYLDLSSMTVRQEYLHNEADDLWRWRAATGLLNAIKADAQVDDPILSGEVKLSDGTVVHWHADRDAIERVAAGMHDDNRPSNVTPAAWQKKGGMTKRAGEAFTTNSHIVVTYKGENYEYVQKRRMSHFGISHNKVQDLVWLVIEPPVWTGKGKGIHPNQPRTGLIYEGVGDGSLPLNDWAEEFRKNFPAELLLLMEKVKLGGANSEIAEQIKQSLLEHLQQMLDKSQYKDVLVVGTGPEKADKSNEVGSGDKTDHPIDEPGKGGKGIGGSGEKITLGVPGKKTTARKRKQKDGIADILLVEEADMTDSKHITELRHVANKPVIYVNIDHPYVKREVDRWSHQYEYLDATDQVAPMIQYAIGGHALLAWGRLEMDPTVPRKDKQPGSDLLSGEVLSMSARLPVDHLVKSRLSQR